MLGRMVCLICCVVTLGLVGGASASVPEGTILIGWHSPEIATPTNDSTPDDFLPGVEGLLSGGYDVQNKNSTDGTYGSGPATPASTINAVRVRLDQPSRAFALVTIANKTGSSLYLGVFHFDYGRWYDASPRDVALYYDHGDLTNDPNTLIGSASELPVSGASGNYSDFDYSLSVLNDVVLENGQSATFRLQISNATSASTAGGLDNIAITAGISVTKASGPVPDDQQTDVSRKVVLSWTPGEFAKKHDVYFGTVLSDVDNASKTNPLGVLASQNQDPNFYALPQRLELGQTYYWRIDEVNAPPSSTVYKGDVWSFTVEPVGYPIDGTKIIATASSVAQDTFGPENTIDGSGLDQNGGHSIEAMDMWLSGNEPQGAWIQYEFDKAYKLHEIWVWNSNQSTEAILGVGIKDVAIEYSANGTDWTTLAGVPQFAQAPGAIGYAHNTTVSFGGVVAKYVKLSPTSNWRGLLPQYGLSEVRFFYIPVVAGTPSPNSGVVNVPVDTTLSWRAGREAATHNLYLSTNEQAVIDGTVPPITVTKPSYSASLDLASTYYWRVDEVNNVETPAVWQGNVWNLSTIEYSTVDDFESYNDIPTGQEGSRIIYETWSDGYGNPANGSTIGYSEPYQPTMESSMVYDGKQSAPFSYNNTTATYSEIAMKVANLGIDRDWSKHGVKALALRFAGDPNNVAQQMYAKINGIKVTCNGDPENYRRMGWQMWYIDLASMGVNLTNVTDLSIGFERIGATGGRGRVYLDAIRLYSYARQTGTPVDPGTTGLQAYYQFEGNTADSSGNQRNGTALGGPVFTAGKTGQALSFDGLEDYVSITGYKGVPADTNGIQQPFTITAWVNSTDSGDRTMVSWGTNTSMQRVDFRLYQGSLRIEHGSGYVLSHTPVNNGNWHPVAVTVNQGATVSYPSIKLWADGNDDTIASTDPDAFSIRADLDVTIGCRITSADRFFLGSLDEVRIYNRVLSQEEIAWLAGQTQPFDKPF